MSTPVVPPLAGVTVVDLTRVLSGPFATMMLGDLGADVIKIERIEGGDDTRHIPPFVGGESHYFLSVNRNKRSVAVNMKSSAGWELVRKLVEHADIVVENFRPGVAAAMGLDYDSLRAGNERLIYCSISGFGQTGHSAQQPAFDIVVQALSGALSVNGHLNGEPVKIGLPIGDVGAGIFATVGILAALASRERTQRGSYVDVSMLDAMLGTLGHLAGQYLIDGKSPTPVGSSHQNIAPYGSFPVADGHIVIATLTPIFWPRLCHALELEELRDDPRFATNELRLQNRVELDALITQRLLQQSVDEWCVRFTAEDVPHAPIRSVGEALEAAYAEGRSTVMKIAHPTVGEVRIPGPIIHFDGAVGAVLPPPLFGQHTIEVLRDLAKLPDDAIRDLLASGVVSAVESAGALMETVEQT